MIIINTEPYSIEEVEKLKERYEVYIKAVIDIEKKICCSGMEMHYEGEQRLLQSGSKQSDVWGGGFDLATKAIDYNSFVNIRPNDNNFRNDIESEQLRVKFSELMKYFFSEIL